MGKGIGGHTSPNKGNTNIWLTPRHVLDALGKFDLDPCAAPDPKFWCTAKHYYIERDNGLKKKRFGRVWCNPPYSQESYLWLNKLAKHGNGIALIFARTETFMFFECVWEKADAILFLKGRLFFHDRYGVKAKSNAGGPSCLIAYGRNNVKILKTCGLDGQFVVWDKNR